MTSFRTLLASGLLTAALLPAHAEYIAETGRTEKHEVSASAVGQLAGSAADPHAGHSHEGHAHGEEAGPAPVAAVQSTSLYDAAVEKALLESGIGHIAVQAEGVNTSLRTFAEVQVNQITGQTRFKMEDGKRMDPLYAALGMVYQQKAWVHAPILPVEDARLAERMGLDPKGHHRVSPAWVMKTPAARNLVMPALMGGGQGADAALSEDEKKALSKFTFRLGTFLNLPSEFKLVPMMGEVKGEWLSPSHLNRPELIETPELQMRVASLDRQKGPYAATLALDAALRKAFDERNPAELTAATTGLLAALDGTQEYMSPTVRWLDYQYTAFHPFQKAALFSMLSFFAYIVYFMTVRRRRDGGAGKGSNGAANGRESAEAPVQESPAASPVMAFAGGPALALAGVPGAVAFDGAGAGVADAPAGPLLRRPGSASGKAGYGDPSLLAEQEVPRGSVPVWGTAYALQVVAALIILIGLLARFAIGGRMPVSNMYESIMFAMGAFAVVGVIFEAIYRRGWVGVGAAFAGWTLMTAANSMPIHMRKVEPLVAVLKSVWLNYHVTALLISYSAFLLAFVCGVLYFVKDLTGNKPGALPRKEMFEYISYRAIQVGWPLLTLGIFLGAVWANTAWGSYWSWDPKETWALITWFAYTIYLHLRMIMGWTNRRAVIANMVGFIMVLLTYFGVSYLPGLSGGMHSYAAPISK